MLHFLRLLPRVLGPRICKKSKLGQTHLGSSQLRARDSRFKGMKLSNVLVRAVSRPETTLKQAI